MTRNRKGFTLTEVIVVLVILAILTAIMIPAMAGWIDQARERRLIVACRACVVAAQTLASETYGTDNAVIAPADTAVKDLAGVNGITSGIKLDPLSAAVDTLTYQEDTESVTYMRLPVPQYVFGAGIAGITASVREWAKQYVYQPDQKAKEYLTIDYKKQNPEPLTTAQTAAVFGDLTPYTEPQYIYPMAIFDTKKELMDIQYVTSQDPTTTSGQNRYAASAFIIDGKTYICAKRSSDNKVMSYVNAKDGTNNTFQRIMNNVDGEHNFETAQQFVDLITKSGYYVPAD